MFERFTEWARQVVVLAQDESRALGFNYIGTEHILLGLLREEEGLAASVLESLHITLEEVRVQVAQVAQIVGQGDEVTSGQIPFTPRAKKVLELSLREALSLGHNYIGTEHILLGLVRENEGVAARILLEFNADAEKIRNEILRRLSGPGRRGHQGVRSLDDAATRAELQVAVESALRAVRGDLLLDAVTLMKETCIDRHEFELAARFRDIERRFAGAGSQRGWVAASSGSYFRSDSYDIDATVRGLTVGITERARQVLALAQDEARALKHNYIGTEHILLGLLAEQEGVAARVLESLDITVEEVRAQVVRILGQGDEISRARLPLTPRSKKVLALAQREALSLGHNDIGTEHILLGLVGENEGVAARILLGFEADAEKVRSEVLRIVSDPGRRAEGALPFDVEAGEIDEATRARTIGELVEPIRHRTLDELLGAIARAKVSAANDGQRAVIAVGERCVLGLIACIGELVDNHDPPAPSDAP